MESYSTTETTNPQSVEVKLNLMENKDKEVAIIDRDEETITVG